MRCAIDFEEDTPLYEQEIKAWGELQSLKEEPAYRESDIKNEKEIEFFKGYKYAFDDVCNILDNLSDDIQKEITEEQAETIQQWMGGQLCMMLFSILDNEEFSEGE